jgi:hypothetical protein
MSYKTSKSVFVNAVDLNLNPLESPITVDGYSAVVELPGDQTVARLRLLTTSVSTSDVCDVTIQTSADGTTYYTAGTFTQIATTIDATWDQRKDFIVNRYVRAHYNLTGASMSIAVTLLGDAL